MVRAHILFKGTVQGVGFRYTTLNFARDLALTGWVKNLPDGNVEAVVEGSRSDIEELIEKLKQRFAGHIHEHHVEWLEFREEFEHFGIEF